MAKEEEAWEQDGAEERWRAWQRVTRRGGGEEAYLCLCAGHAGGVRAREGGAVRSAQIVCSCVCTLSAVYKMCAVSCEEGAWARGRLCASEACDGRRCQVHILGIKALHRGPPCHNADVQT